jgi:hypothetical protein
VRYFIQMLTRRIFASSFCVAAMVVTASAQKCIAVHKMFTAASTDPSLKDAATSANKQKTVNEMVAAVQGNPKLMVIITSSGLSPRELCPVPIGMMAASGAYMIQTEYKKDASNLASADN